MNKKPIAAGKSSFSLMDTNRLFDIMTLPEGGIFLDAACGPGDYSMEAARRFPASCTIIAIDLWEEGIRKLKKQIDKAGFKNVYAKVADISRHIPIMDEKIDFCLLCCTLHDLIYDGTGHGALKEIARVLKPFGLLAVVEFYKKPGPPGPPEPIRLDESETIRLVSDYGFRHTKTCKAGPHNYIALFSKEEIRQKKT